MADYDDDDMIDYETQSQEDEEFNEDELNDEDYNLLYDEFDKLKPMVKDYDISDFKIKEVLYMNYFELDGALSEIKKDFKLKKNVNNSVNQINNSTKKLSKLEQLSLQRKQKLNNAGGHGGSSAHGLAGLVQSKSKSGIGAGHQAGGSGSGGLAGILAKKKNNGPAAVGGLAGLLERKKVETQAHAHDHDQAGVGGLGQKKTGLAALVAQRKSQVSDSHEGGSAAGSGKLSSTLHTTSGSSSILEKLRQSKIHQAQARVEKESPSQEFLLVQINIQEEEFVLNRRKRQLKLTKMWK
ncbi:unnamed protein product [Ambrosiozyma monospora]|uniref:Unnamed protein product n=1 Tax=Ambrosiozyma monospora TaxID=43982 RepID=A0ACB5SW99_AMBMO|nr:unnamed protein product [Ambrosiozyma monospora]